MLPNDQRNFVHKRIIGAAGGFLSGGFTGAATGFVRGGRRSGGQPVAPSASSRSQLRFGGRPCGAGMVPLGRGGRCVADPKKAGPLALIQRIVPGGATGRHEFGDAVMGVHGAGLQPAIEDRMVRICPPGMVLGRADGLCYNRRDIANKAREYPRGTRPLGTPGEMAALRKAASFGRRMETTVKRMQKIGVLKKPSRGRRPGRPAPRQIGPGPSIINVE